MQRVHKKHRIYTDKDFKVQSLTSLVKMAKEKTIERTPTDATEVSVHEISVRLTKNLQHMHHQLQGLLMQKLGPDARNIITAERAREVQLAKDKLNADEIPVEDHEEAKVIIAKHLADVGNEHTGDELQQLNVYRERYAAMLAELEIARENMVELERRLEDEDESNGDDE
jgi:hypothetical protein